MKKFNVGDKVLFTIHKIPYNAIVIETDLCEHLYKIHNTDTNSLYWVEQHRLSRIPKFIKSKEVQNEC